MARRGYLFVVAARGIVALAVTGAACGSPNRPTPQPPVVGPATAPVIRSIAVPTSRVETGRDITITAVVEDAETPLSQLTYVWTSNIGTITGTGTTATWRHAPGLQRGADVVVTLMVKDTYDAILGNQIVKQDFFVLSQAAPFRVHDSVAEVKELARKFLVDLFGTSSVSPIDCMVDFSDVCADLPEGKKIEFQQVVDHRRDYVVLESRVLGQTVDWRGSDTGSVHSVTYYRDRRTDSGFIGTTCGDFELTVVYVTGRWWLCQSYFNRGPQPLCADSLNNGGVARIFGRGRL